MKKGSLTVIMLTLNEEYYLAEAIDNVQDIAEEIFILDSLSSDKTVDIALDKGVKILQRPFTNFGDQWNYALENFPVKTEWTLKLDPDERLTEVVKDSIRTIMNSKDSYHAYSVNFRLWFMGKPLNTKIKNIVRLWKTGTAKFSDNGVNEHLLPKGEIGVISGFIEHLDSKDMHHWLEKQNLYTSIEANRKFKGESLATKPNLLGNVLERRMFYKYIFFKIPMRYTLQFLHEFFYRGAWKDGIHGLRWVNSRIMCRKLVEVKYKECLIRNALLDVKKNAIGTYDKRV